MASSLKTKKPRPKAEKPVESKIEIEEVKTETPQIDSDFQKVIDESKVEIQNAGIKEVKKKGRPRKIDSQAQASPQVQAQGPVTPPPDVSQFLVVPLQALSKLPANKHKMPDLALSTDEAQACAKALNDCLNAFVPDIGNMSPKTAAIIGLCMTVGTIGFTKYSIYSEETQKRYGIKEPEIETKISPMPPILEPEPNLAAENYFTKSGI